MEKITIAMKPWVLILCTTILSLTILTVSTLIVISNQTKPEYQTVEQHVIDLTMNYILTLAKSKRLDWPIQCASLNSGFGYRYNPIRRFIGGKIVGYHSGLDLPATNGQPFTASADGEVIGKGWSVIGGYYLVIDYYDGITATYYHLSGYEVKMWDLVGRGDVIGRVGKTGITTGAHLHYQIEYNGVPMDPRIFLQIAA